MTRIKIEDIPSELDRLEQELETNMAIHGAVPFSESYPRFKAALDREDYRTIAETEKDIERFCRRCVLKIARGAYAAGDYQAAAEGLVELRDGITRGMRESIFKTALQTL